MIKAVGRLCTVVTAGGGTGHLDRAAYHVKWRLIVLPPCCKSAEWAGTNARGGALTKQQHPLRSSGS
ncbi:hypothetical protein [Azospirillum argentinense]